MTAQLCARSVMSRTAGGCSFLRRLDFTKIPDEFGSEKPQWGGVVDGNSGACIDSAARSLIEKVLPLPS